MAGMTEANDRETRRADLIRESASEVFFERTPEARSSLVEAIERCYHSGEAAGQMWLHDLSAYLRALPLDDPRLEALAARGPRPAVDDYLLANAHPLASGLHPSGWLDAYLAGPTTGTTLAPGAQSRNS